MPLDAAGRGFVRPSAEASALDSSILVAKPGIAPAAGPGGLVGAGDARMALPGPGELQQPVSFRYRTVEFTLPSIWYTTYQADLRDLYASYQAADDDWAQMSYGLVSSTNDTIDTLWSGLQNTAPNFEAAFDLIECYNLHRGGQEVRKRYRFWRFSWGAPLMVHLWTQQMLLNFQAYLTYGGWRSDVESRVTECAAMGAFVVTLLNGGASSGRKDWLKDEADAPGACYLTISYRSDGSDAHEVREPCYSDYACDETYKPYGDNACTGLAWNAWTLGWQADEHCFTADGTSDGDCKRPDTRSSPSSCIQNAHQHQFSVNLHASELAYQGAVCDWVMYLARMALDYARWLTANGGAAGEVALYADVADKLARYALVVLAYNGRHWLHEIGHAWLGTSSATYDTDDLIWSGAHCKYNCCNDVVADNWLCKVRGWLGLPYKEYESYDFSTYADDYSVDAETVHRESADGCSTDELAVRIWTCDVVQNGLPHMQAYFCSTGCYAHVEYSWGGSHHEVWLQPDGSMTVAYADEEADAVCPE